MGSILFYVLDSILILFCTYHIISFLVNRDDDVSFLISMIIGFVLSVIAMIIYIITDGGSFIPSILLGINGMVSAWAINRRSTGYDD